MTPPRPGLAAVAAAPIDATDVANLDRVAELYSALDPVPGGLVERIRFGMTLDALHAEIAELQRSSDLVGVRSDDDAAGTQTVTFTSPTLTTMVTITPRTPDTARIDGWIAPGADVSVELRTTSGTRSVTADDTGRFAFEDVSRGLVQFVLRLPGDTDDHPIVTPSIEI